MAINVPAHLGGFTPGGDPATWYPELWSWLVAEMGVSKVLDVGCGEGQAVDYFASLGCLAHGIDGVASEKLRVVQHDYSTGPLDFELARYDLCWSSEFVEHVEERYAENYLATFRACDLLLMTHADPGQLGHHHVNCQEAGYWIDLLERSGFDYDPNLTTATRSLAAMNTDPLNHYLRSGLAFRRSA